MRSAGRPHRKRHPPNVGAAALIAWERRQRPHRCAKPPIPNTCNVVSLYIIINHHHHHHRVIVSSPLHITCTYIPSYVSSHTYIHVNIQSPDHPSPRHLARDHSSTRRTVSTILIGGSRPSVYFSDYPCLLILC